MTTLPDRLEVCDAGHGFAKSKYMLFYKVAYYQSNQMLGILQTFSPKAWIAIGTMNVVFILVIILMNRLGHLQRILASINSVLKACLGGSFEQEVLTGKFKWTRMNFIFTMSLGSGLFFWTFCGIITSNLTVQKHNLPFKSLDGLARASDNIRIAIYKNSITSSFFEKWSKKNPIYRKAFENNIVHYSTPEMKEHIQSKGNTALYIPEVYIPPYIPGKNLLQDVSQKNTETFKTSIKQNL